MARSGSNGRNGRSSSRSSKEPRKSASTKRKSAVRRSSQQKDEVRRPRRGGGLSPAIVLRLLAVVVVVAVVVIFGPALLSAGTNLWTQLLASFGLGLILLLVAVGVLAWLVIKGFGPLARHWHVFLGAVVAGAGLWGVLALFKPTGSIFYTVTMGGEAGQAILGSPDGWGIAKVSLLVLAGVILMVPGPLVSATRALFRPRPRSVKPVAPATLERSPSPVSSARSVLAEEDNSHATQTRLPFQAPSAAPDKVPMLDSEEGKRGLFFSRKPKTEPEAKPVAPPVEPTPEVHPGAEFATASATDEPMREPVLTVGGWQIPPVDVLDRPKETELNREEVDKRARLIEEALNSYGVEGKVVQINTGPTVTQFGVEPGWLRKFKKMVDENGDERQEEISRTRIRVDRITALSNDLALALAAPSIRIEAPIPGKSLVGIEVPNSAFGSVSLRSVIESTSFQKMHVKTKLSVALGKGAGGEAVSGDLTKMPHLLIAGSTGSGKTVCLDSIICCLLMHNSPDDLRVLLVDPKRVELVAFSEIPHLAAPVVVEADKAVKVLRWLNAEMDRRYREFAKAKARNIEAYNKDRSPGETMPYLVLVVDELADLMMAAFDEVEHSLCRLAQLARATGIHLIVATQRPSVDVVTGLIKANFPTRISFAVTSQVDSRTILDTVGAEKLLGRGDMLYLPSEAGRPKRLQGTFLSDAEMERIVQFWAGQRRQEQAIVNLDEVEGPDGDGKKVPAVDPMLEEARKLAAEHKQISASFLQRRLRIGYPRAARIMEQLEMEGAMGEDPAEEKPPFEI